MSRRKSTGWTLVLHLSSDFCNRSPTTAILRNNERRSLKMHLFEETIGRTHATTHPKIQFTRCRRVAIRRGLRQFARSRRRFGSGKTRYFCRARRRPCHRPDAPRSTRTACHRPSQNAGAASCAPTLRPALRRRYCANPGDRQPALPVVGYSKRCLHHGTGGCFCLYFLVGRLRLMYR